MNQIVMRLWRILRFPLLLSTIALPVPLAVVMYQVPQLLPFVWVFPLCYLCLDLIGTCLRGKWRLLYSLAGAAFWIVLGLLSVNYGQGSMLMLPAALYGILFVWGMATTGASRYEQIQVKWYVIGILMHIAAQLMLYSDRVTESHALDPVSPWITGSFYLFAALAMLSQNHASLAYAAGGRQSVSETMRRKNVVLVMVFFGIAALLSTVPALATLVSKIFMWVVSAVLWIISLLDNGQSAGSSGDAQQSGQDDFNMGLGGGEAAPIWQVLTVVAGVLTAVGLAVLAIYGLYRLIRKLPDVLHMLLRLMNRYANAVSEDFVDEITDTRDLDDKEMVKKQKRQSVDERKLLPDQRIRYRYSLLMKKHRWSRGSTARENLPNAMANMYERVRYSDYTATEQEAQQFTADAKRV